MKRRLLLFILLAISLVISNIIPVMADTIDTITINSSDLDDNEEPKEVQVGIELASYFTVKIPKSISLDGTKGDSQGKASYKVSVLGDLTGEQVINVVPDSSFNLIQVSKDSITTTVTQNKTSFNYRDTKNNKIATSDGLIEAGALTAGTWSGTFNFNVNAATREVGNSISVVAKDKSGKVLQASANTIIGDEKDVLLDKLDESGLANKEDIKALIEVESNDFDGLASTTFDVSGIANVGEKVVILHYNEKTGEWEYIGTDTVKEDCTVEGDFTSYSPVAFIVIKEDGTEEIIVHEHTYGEWTITKDATCTEIGFKERICSSCKNKETQDINALGHNFSEEFTIDKEATLEEVGFKSRHCLRCDEKIDVTEIPKIVPHVHTNSCYVRVYCNERQDGYINSEGNEVPQYYANCPRCGYRCGRNWEPNYVNCPKCGTICGY